jgi:hypothetical protein
MTAEPAGPAELKPLWRRVVAVLVAGVAIGVVGGLALGVVWWRLAPRVPLLVRPDLVVPDQYQPGEYLGADVTFAMLALVAGLAVTIGLVTMRRDHLIAALGSGIVAGIVGSMLMWAVGSRLGSVDIAGLAATIADEQVVDGPLQLTMPAVLLVWPIASAVVVTIVAVIDFAGERRQSRAIGA